MSLTKNDLQAIEGLLDRKLDEKLEEKLEEKLDKKLAEQRISIIEEVKDLIDFRAEQTEQKLETRLGARIDSLENKMDRGFQKVDREIDDLIEMNREFINKFDNHEKRIVKLEVKVKNI